MMKIFGRVVFYSIIAVMTAAVLTGCQTLLDEFLAIDWETPAEAPEEPKAETPAPEPAAPAPPPEPEPAVAEIADQRMTEILDEPEEVEEDFLVIDSIADPFEVLLQDPLILLITAPETNNYVFRHLTFDVIDVYAAVFDFEQDAPLNDNFDGEQLTETFEADLVREESYLIFIAPLDDKDFGKTVRFSVLPAEKPPEPAEIPDPEPPAPEVIPDPEPPAPVVIPDPEPAPPEVPAAVPPVRTDERIKMIAAGYENSFVLLHDGTLLATGHNGFGQFGDGTGISRTSFTPIADNVKTFSVSEFGHLLAVKNDGALYTSGYNVYGQLGDGTKTDRFSFVKTADGVRSVSAGSGHSMILKEDGTLWAAGDNTFGQLGDGTREHRSTFVQVAQQVASVHAGNSHTVLVKEDGSIWAAGHNSFGELGDGTTRIRTSFVRVAGSADQVYAEGGRTLLLQDSQLSAAGQNWYGELGRKDPQALSQFTTLASEVGYVSSGAFHTMFIDTDGVLHAAGFNGSGRLGSGTLAPVSSFTPVSKQVIAVSAGARHTLMLKEDGTLWAAGNNDHGQLGIGSTENSLVFVPIRIPGHEAASRDFWVSPPRVPPENLAIDSPEVLELDIPSERVVPRTYSVSAGSSPEQDPVETVDGEYQVGSIGPAGGIIFYDKGEYNNHSVSLFEGSNDNYTIDEDSDVGFSWRYMEVAPSGWYGEEDDPVFRWGGMGILIGTTKSIGTGKANTDAVISFWEEWLQYRIDNPSHSDYYTEGYDYSDSRIQTFLAEGKIPADISFFHNPVDWNWLDGYPAKACAEFSVTVNGVTYDDWFLPSFDALQQIWWNLISDRSSSNLNRGKRKADAIGGFTSVASHKNRNFYWSSYEVESYTIGGQSPIFVTMQNFIDGVRNIGFQKDTDVRVRPVRAF